MAEFACRVGTDEGICQRSVVAASPDVARELLAAQGFEVFAVRRRDGWIQRLGDGLGFGRGAEANDSVDADDAAQPTPPLGLFARRHVAPSDRLLLTVELAALIRAGLPLLKCVDILRSRRSGTAPGGVLDRVRDRVAAGLSLSAAFAQEHPDSRIPRLFITSVTIGETSGDLEGALRRYGRHLERTQTMRSKVRGALLYPAALFTVSLGAIGVLIGFVLPRFADFYSNYDAQLPLPTRVLMAVAGLAQRGGGVTLVVLIVAAVALFLASRSGAGRELREELAFRVPLLGGLRRLYLDVESSRTMATLLRGGAPLTEALEVAADGTENTIYRRRLRRVRDLVSEGNSLHKSLEVTELMDSMGLEMVEVGESTGMLEEMLGHVADSYDEMLERRLNTVLSLLEPAVLVTMGLFIAAVLLSLYLPLFNVAQVI